MFLPCIARCGVFHVLFVCVLTRTQTHPLSLCLSLTLTHTLQEDLEEFEVRDAIESYERDVWSSLADDVNEQQQRAAKRQAYLEVCARD